MRKTVLFAAALATSMFSFAQEETKEALKSKKGHVILPQKGDIAIGFNAIPVIDMALNVVNIQEDLGQQGNGVITYTESSNHQIVGKYYLADDAAVKVRFGYNTLRGSFTNQVQDALAMAEAVKGTQDDIDAASLIKVNDELHYQKSNVNLAVGYEKRRGYGRLQGFYGGEVGINWTKSDAQAEYGNEFSDQHQVQYTRFNSNTSITVFNLDPTSTTDRSRFLDREFTGGIGFGVRAYIGVEYFFAPKMSIAAEYGFGYAYTNQSSEKTTQETYHNGQTGPVVLIEEIDSDQSSSEHVFGVDNNNSGFSGFSNSFQNTSLSGASGSITLLFHF